MKPVTVKFNEGSFEENQFNSCKDMYAKFQESVSKKIDCSDANQIIEHMTELTSMLSMGAVCKATLEYLTDKLSVKALMNLRDIDGSANERKVMLAFAIGDCSFYNNVVELLIKEAHYKIEILRSSLSYCKSELNIQ
jgi:hypothetical protein